MRPNAHVQIVLTIVRTKSRLETCHGWRNVKTREVRKQAHKERFTPLQKFRGWAQS